MVDAEMHHTENQIVVSYLNPDVTMKRLLIAACMLLACASEAAADVPSRERPSAPQQQPASEPKPHSGSTGCGFGLTAGIVLAGFWLLRPRRRLIPQS